MPLTFRSTCEEDTARLGRALAETLPRGTVVTLLGTLGAGKTRLVRCVAAALGIDPETVVSPTFVLVREYQGQRGEEGAFPLYHFDAYRLRDEDEFDQLGPDEYFDGEGLSFVEWADRVALSIPPDHLEIAIAVTGEESREMTIASRGEFPREAVEAIREKISRRDF